MLYRYYSKRVAKISKKIFLENEVTNVCYCRCKFTVRRVLTDLQKKRLTTLGHLLCNMKLSSLGVAAISASLAVCCHGHLRGNPRHVQKELRISSFAVATPQEGYAQLEMASLEETEDRADSSDRTKLPPPPANFYPDPIIGIGWGMPLPKKRSQGK